MVKISLIQFKPEIAEKEKNLEIISRLVNKCSGDIILLPELATTGYAFPNTESLIPYAEIFDSRSETINLFQKLAMKKNCLIAAGLAEKSETEKGILYNSSVAVSADGLLASYRKLHLFGREKRIFKSGSLPPPVFTYKDVKYSLLICFDWVFQELFRLLAIDGVQVILHSANLVLPWCQRSMVARALTNGIYIATTNRIGSEREGLEELTFTGSSQVVSPFGEVKIKAGEDTEEIVEVEIDSDLALDKSIGTANNRFDDRRTDIYSLKWIEKENPSWEEIIAMALKAMNNAYVPYSKYYVGAALTDENGNIYTGCNVENSSYGLTICAERAAVCNMTVNGGGKIKKIVIASENGVNPCGACLQVIQEFGDDPEIMIVSKYGDRKLCTLKEFLPMKFSKKDLL